MFPLINLRKVTVSLVMFAVVVLGSVIAIKADTVFIISGSDFSGTTQNTGGNLTVTISNIAGGVRISIANNLVDPGAFVDELYLNTSVAPLAAASASCVACTSIGVVAGNNYNGSPGWQFGSDAYKADGDGFYDLLLTLPNANNDPNRLTPGESVVFDVTATTVGFNADSFHSISLPGGGNGPFEVAAHVQGLPNGGSDFLTTTVPEPASLLLLGSGLVGIAGGLRRILHR